MKCLESRRRSTRLDVERGDCAMEPRLDTGTRTSHRLFYALWPDDATRAALARIQGAMHGRRTPFQNLHMTLAFLGQQPSERLPLLQQLLADLPKTEIPLVMDRIGYFPRNRIAWIGMHAVPVALTALQRSLMQDLERHEIRLKPESSFKPHVTLARDSTAPPEILFNPIHWQATKFALVRSTTELNGACYQVLASCNAE
jgi:2'-5' RNA ligase